MTTDMRESSHKVTMLYEVGKMWAGPLFGGSCGCRSGPWSNGEVQVRQGCCFELQIGRPLGTWSQSSTKLSKVK